MGVSLRPVHLIAKSVRPSDGKLSLAQPVKHGQLFRDWPRGESLPVWAFARP